MARGIAVALALFAASPAFAQDGEYTVDGATVRVPAPAGYCASGEGVDAYRAAQRAKSGTMPEVILMRCGAETMSLDMFAILVVPDEAPMTLDAMLAESRRELPQAETKPTLVSPDFTASMNARLGAVLDAGTTVNTGIKPVGVDDVCGYVAGLRHVEVPGRGLVDEMTVGCATVISGRLTYLFRYRPGADHDQAIASMPELKALAVASGAGK